MSTFTWVQTFLFRFASWKHTKFLKRLELSSKLKMPCFHNFVFDYNSLHIRSGCIWTSTHWRNIGGFLFPKISRPIWWRFMIIVGSLTYMYNRHEGKDKSSYHELLSNTMPSKGNSHSSLSLRSVNNSRFLHWTICHINISFINIRGT